MGSDSEIGDTGWFSLEPFCFKCKGFFEVSGSEYGGFVELKCECRRIPMNRDVLGVLDRLDTCAEKSFFLNGYSKVKTRAFVGEYGKEYTAMDVVETANSVKKDMEGAPLNKEKILLWLQIEGFLNGKS